jgi:hypothetical protein
VVDVSGDGLQTRPRGFRNCDSDPNFPISRGKENIFLASSSVTRVAITRFSAFASDTQSGA